MNKSIPSTDMADAFEPFNLEAALYGDAIREALASLPPLPEQGVPKFTGYLLEQEKDEIAKLQTSFVARAASLRKTPRTSPSRPTQCAYFILSAVYMPLLREAFAAYIHHNPYEFIICYDYASGIVEVAGELCMTANREQDRQGSQLLAQDPTGKTLIAAIVDEIRAEAHNQSKDEGIQRILEYQNPTLFLAGAEFTQRLYTALYPLSQ
jgi:hypothetical protein